MKKFKNLIAILTASVMLATTPGHHFAAAEPQQGDAGDDPQEITLYEAGGEYERDISYDSYLAEHGAASRPDRVIEIKGSNYLTQENAQAKVLSYMGRDNVLYWDSQEGSVTWEFEAEEEGLYHLYFDYCPIELKSADIQMGIRIDGKFPFRNAKTITLPRLFLDETYQGYRDWEFKQDVKGNEIRPKVNEVFEWQNHGLIDKDGQYNGQLEFYLSKGTHTISLELQMEALAIDALRFCRSEKTAPYEEVKQQWDQQGAEDTKGFSQMFQAEKSYLKSSNTLFPTFDNSSVTNLPSDPYALLYNTIGENTWDSAGEYITWEFEVPQDGYYYFSFKAKQNIKRGMYSAREMMIDGKALFEEMKDLKFENKNSWYIKTLEDAKGEPYKIYLSQGKHILRLGVTVGGVADLLRRVDEDVAKLNKWYREIVKITGINADEARITIDAERDFLLDQKIPGLMEGFAEVKADLEGVLAEIEAMDDLDVSSASILQEAVALLGQFIKKPGKIANRIETYRNNISSLTTWTIEMRLQPLELDYFTVYSPDSKEPKIKANLFQQLWYRSCMFVYSFFNNYNDIAGTADTDQEQEALEVWISTSDLQATGVSAGRDQATLLKRMVDDMFIPEKKIPVKVSLVNSSSTLTQAVLAGKGPDVALFVSKETPVNLAMRGALYDLSSFEDFEEVTTQFMPSAMIPYQYKGRYYALPETQSFDMLFYRTDIFAELGFEPPRTWEEFYALIPALMDENYLVGVPESQRTFEMFLYQNGGQFYTDDLTRTTFDTGTALTAFRNWTGLYSKYSLPLVFDFFNRFRNGEMPMGIMPYTNVNYLSAAAPELKNLWDIVPVPGTVQEDQSIDRSETSNGTAAILLADAKNPEQAYEFLKWWVSSEAQSRFGVELEQNMGPGARYPTANVDAFQKLPWTKQQSESLMEQWKHVTEIPQIPGSYYISRNVAFAFKSVVYDKKNERETLYKYNIEINKEIARKQKEFEY
ncbi:ABC-type glycerol-3-phosphate transport system substrate-binding protein [Anaerotaenia torta]|uniref:extracellular solute-binding protein n=1 Tax=Anaerotaenia torta TaxID=433293 RepID=UPI003D200BD7